MNIPGYRDSAGDTISIPTVNPDTTIDFDQISDNIAYWPPPIKGNDLTIKLSLSEIETLREYAEKDENLREILQKFAPHIDIEVDF